MHADRSKQHDRGPATPTVLVLGGTGFIGRHAVAALCARHCRVVTGSRRAGARAPRAGEGRWRQADFVDLLAPGDWDRVLGGIDVVLNCVGILRQRGRASYERVHCLAPAALAAACRDRGLRLIHVSALGLDARARSRFLRSKLAGEHAIRASGADWRIVRPSLLDGDGGYGARWLRRVARWPVHPVPADAAGRIAALDVRDLGEALARLALAAEPAPATAAAREFDLGGPQRRTLAEHLLALRRLSSPRPAWRLPLPGLLARLGSHVCDLLQLTPYSFGHWELLRRDNCPAHNRLPELLGRPPRAVGLPAAAVPRRAPALPLAGEQGGPRPGC